MSFARDMADFGPRVTEFETEQETQQQEFDAQLQTFEDAYEVLLGFDVISTNQTLVTGQQVISEAASDITVTLPATPTIGDSVAISNQGTGTVTVARNGSNIKSVADDGALAAGKSTRLSYVNATIGWAEL